MAFFARWLVKFFDKPRGRFTCLLGAFFIIPIIKGLDVDIKRFESRIDEKVMLKGRLELTQTLLTKWWKK